MFDELEEKNDYYKCLINALRHIGYWMMFWEGSRYANGTYINYARKAFLPALANLHHTKYLQIVIDELAIQENAKGDEAYLKARLMASLAPTKAGQYQGADAKMEVRKKKICCCKFMMILKLTSFFICINLLRS